MQFENLRYKQVRENQCQSESESDKNRFHCLHLHLRFPLCIFHHNFSVSFKFSKMYYCYRIIYIVEKYKRQGVIKGKKKFHLFNIYMYKKKGHRMMVSISYPHRHYYQRMFLPLLLCFFL